MDVIQACQLHNLFGVVQNAFEGSYVFIDHNFFFEVKNVFGLGDCHRYDKKYRKFGRMPFERHQIRSLLKKLVYMDLRPFRF